MPLEISARCLCFIHTNGLSFQFLKSHSVADKLQAYGRISCLAIEGNACAPSGSLGAVHHISQENAANFFSFLVRECKRNLSNTDFCCDNSCDEILKNKME
ncbi:hypothetical protein ABZP36_004667 [Zizania latifolia]